MIGMLRLDILLSEDKKMGIVEILIIVCVLIFILWLVTNYMPVPWKTPVLVVIVLIAVIWLLTLMFPSISNFRIH